MFETHPRWKEQQVPALMASIPIIISSILMLKYARDLATWLVGKPTGIEGMRMVKLDEVFIWSRVIDGIITGGIALIAMYLALRHVIEKVDLTEYGEKFNFLGYILIYSLALENILVSLITGSISWATFSGFGSTAIIFLGGMFFLPLIGKKD